MQQAAYIDLMKIKGNTILITGGTSGIGFEFAKQFLALGNEVIVTGRDAKKLERAKAALPKVHAIQSDVSQIAEVNALYAKVSSDFPGLNILLNNAGIMKIINMHDETNSMESLSQEIDINLIAPIRMAQIFLPLLKKQSEAALVNVSSGLAFVPLPVSPVYCATKAGLHSFTQSLRVQCKNSNLKIFEVAPPATETELLSSTMTDDEKKAIGVMSVEEMVSISIKGIASNRFEIRPGQSNQLKVMSRIAPEFILKQLSRNVDKMMAQKKGQGAKASM